MKNIAELIKTGKATLVDVRTPAEFMDGHLPGSINIPLPEIPKNIHEFRKMKNIIVCCASGVRSRQANMLLRENGIKSEDGGSWRNVPY
jgi:phage shock protein E